MFLLTHLATALLVAIAFAVVVIDTERGNGHFGSVGKVAVAMAETPWTLKQLVSGKSPMEAIRTIYYGQSGWNIRDPEAGAALDGYLLLSRFDGDRQQHVVELLSLPDLTLRHRWIPDADALLDGAPRNFRHTNYAAWSTGMYRAIHPLLFDNGDLLIKDHQSVLIRISPCGVPVWRLDDVLYHHSSEPDIEGAIWVPSLSDPPAIDGASPDLLDDTLSRISPEGDVLFRKSLTEAFVENGLFHLMFTSGTYTDDPLHLNDIQPVLEDGPHWRRGDLLLSLRHQSMIVLYRPSTNRIVWSKAGPWLAQHDVDILDDHRIAVFNNNAYDIGHGGYVKGSAKLSVYDFDTDTVSAQHDGTMAAEGVATQSEGLVARTSGGHVVVEQENDGRLLILAPDGRVFAEFINGAENGKVYRLGWSRVISPALGAQARSGIAAAGCAAP